MAELLSQELLYRAGSLLTERGPENTRMLIMRVVNYYEVVSYHVVVNYSVVVNYHVVINNHKVDLILT